AIELPQQSDNDLRRFGYVPALIDAALQSTLGLLNRHNLGPETLFAPFSLAEIELLKPLTRSCFAVVKARAGRSRDGSGLKRFDIQIVDEWGEVLVRIEDFSVRAVDTAAFQPYRNPVDKNEVVVLKPAWSEDAASETVSQDAKSSSRVLLVFADALDPVVDKFSGDLDREGIKQCILVRSGDEFKKINSSEYSVRPNVSDDYRKLLSSLGAGGVYPDAILHLWAFSLNGSRNDLTFEIRRGFYSVLYLCQSFAAQKASDSLRIVYAYPDDATNPHPALAAVSALLRCVALEIAGINYKAVALQTESRPYGEFHHILLKEVLADTSWNTELKYKGSKRFQRIWEERLSAKAVKPLRTALRQKGAYLITGGAGSLGLIFAEYLAEAAQARLALVGRSQLSSESLSRIEKMRGRGADVIYIQADISRKNEVTRAVSETKLKFGEINGIIHSAGVIRDSLVVGKTEEQVAAVCGPKMYGAFWLDEATSQDQLDFFILFSSAAGVLGNIGQSDYAFANSYLDNFAFQRESLRSSGRRTGLTVSIDWPLWENGGISVDRATVDWMRENKGLTPLKTAAGIGAMEAALGAAENQALVLQGDRKRILGALSPQETLIESTSYSTTARAAAPHDPQLLEKVENYLKRLLSVEIRLPPSRIASREPLENYGIDSVMVVNMTRQLEKDFGELSKTLFFEFNTIHNLARYFVESHGRGVAEKFGGKTLLDGNKCRDAGVAVASEIRPRFASLKNGRTEVSVSNDIAIIGVSGRYPMADNLDQFWEILKSGRDCVTEIPAERWDHRRICDQNRKGPGSGISEWGGFIDNVDKFDPLFFNISPREAKLMDPQERLFLETVWHTVEDAGYTRADLGNQRVGVFVGAMYAQYQLFSLEPPYKHNGLTPSSLNASIANRISYVFNLRGPSIGLDTMCSSSLTAIHLACSSIRQHECEMAIAGGVNLSLHPNKYLALGQGKFTSSDGRCRSFGEGGDGYVPGEGVGAVLLKPLHLAIADGDHIYAVIKGSAINHGGKTNGYTVPSPVAQSEVVAEALKKAGIDSRRIGYVEAHGTGTSLGDPIEITGLLKAFEAAGGTGDSSDRRKIPIGSVKSNIGHLESAAGIASLTKVILQMKYGQLAPSLHAEQPNPNIDFDRTPFYVQRELTAWDRPTLRENGEERPCPRQAGISSFGAGGSNAHIIIEEYLGPKVSITDAEPQDQVFVLSARNEERLKVYTENIRAFLGGTCGETPAPARREDRLEQVQNPLLQIASEALGISSSEIGLDESLSDYGFDPVSIARLEDLISRRFDIEFTGPPPSGPITLRHYALNVVDATDRPPLEPSESELNPADLAYTLQVGREAMEERVAIVASSVAELRDKLQRYIKGEREIDGVYMGNARRNGLAPAMFLEGKEGEEFFRAIVRERKWGKVAQLWVMGGEVDWRLLHTDSEPRRPARRRLSLPVYPFARERQWLPESAPGAAEIQTSIHPLLDRLDARLSLCEPHGVVFRKTLTNRDPIIRDHVVLDRGILPGVGYLEMARAAIAEVGGQRNFRLRNVALVQPLVVTGATDTQVIIREENNRTLFEIRSATDSSAAHLVHARGECEWETPSGPERRLSIDEIKARCAEVIEKQDLYSQFDAVGIRYGSYYRRVERLWGGDKESLGLLTLPSENKDELRQYALHPAMMDGALQVVAGIAANRSERSGLALPFAIEAVDVMSSLSNRLYAHARMIDIDRYHVDVIDEDGRLCAALRDVRLRQVKRRNEPSNFFYFPSWRRAPSVAGQLGFRTEKAHAGVILVFEPRGGSELEGVLSSALQASRVVRVSLGETTKQLSNDHWRVDTSIPRELDLWLGQIENITGIYFLSGINPERSEPTDTVSLEKSQEDGVISLFRIIKSLDRLGYGARPIEIKVVTDRACQIFEGEFIQPHGASLSGFVKSAAKEYPKWGFSNIDIDLPQYLGPDDDQISNITELIISEPSDSWGNEVAIRGAHRYTRGLLPIDLPAVKQIPFRHQGVYLILGGAGGIGLEFSRFLAEKFLAKLVLIGRGELNAVQKNSLRRIEEVGGEVLYLRADAVDEEGIRIAVQQAKARFSRINGVIHSAIVLKDKTITNMDESVFRASLDPKVKGSVNLYRAIKGEKLDFMLFFSSAQSFSGNAGQSNYSAACSFKDAFANYVGGREQFPVKVINWGYWGEVGVVSSDEYNRRLAAQGIGSIRAEEGINAVTRLLSHQLRQILAIKAEKTLLLPIGLDLNAQAAHVTQSNPSFFSEVVSRTGRASSGAAELLGLKRQFEDVASLGRLLLLDSFQSMGVFTGKGESYCMEKLISRLSIRPRFKRLFDSLLGMLAHAEFISVNGHELRTTSKVESEDVRRGLADLPGVKERLSATYPELTPHLNLLWTCVENLPPILREEVAATDVIFPNSSMGLVEGIYQGNPITDLCNIVIAEAVKAYLHARLPQLEPGERIRIIEIGAGTGGASSRIFDSIRNDSEFVAYDYTDVSVGFIRYGRARYGSLNPFVDFKVLDIEQDVARQEVTPGGYDLVIAANVLHATNDLRGALQNVKSLLKANGCLILNEITEIQDFTTLTFGLLDGWWRYTDADLRLKGSPLLSSTMWETLLREEGFKQARCLEGHGRKGHSLGQSVIIAESDGIVIHRESASGTGRIKEESMRSRAVELPPSKPRLTPDVQSKLALPSLKDAGNYTPATPEFIRNKIIACVSAALTMDKAEIDPERQFSEYGVDSIIGVDLINSINDSLGITLRTTALFDYGSVKEMARYIHSEFAAQITEDRRGVEKEQTQPAGGPVNQPPFSNLDLLEKLAEGSLTTQQVVQLIGV
ncbi:MAG: SDR family NAD(P)-dependent oxidoreductase, partial [Chloracidobacterium sp.]|nr:SDR family NAD(P)-dependent oxidoreductase [Chloracidobacterium sp.]